MMYTESTVLGTTELAERGFITKVYGWMSFALVLTAFMALLTVNSETMLKAIVGTPLFLILIIGELALVWGLSLLINRLSAATATAVFVIYSALNGITLSVVLLVYTAESVATTFFCTAATFGAMSLYGYVTKRDLSSIGNICFMALIGLIIASIVNIFWANSTLYWIITYAGVLIFVGLTAYDTQKIKRMAAMGMEGDTAHKAAIMGALALYLDFINLFLMLLRLLGRRR